MSTDSSFVVERWTRLSTATSIVAAALLIVLALGPQLFTAGIVDNHLRSSRRNGGEAARFLAAVKSALAQS